MPWVTPDERTLEEFGWAQERAKIQAAIPQGWVTHFMRLTYGFEAAARAGGSPIFGVCGHGHVCLMIGNWLHPYPVPFECDRPPATSHTGIF
jgi:hypothetical protein